MAATALAISGLALVTSVISVILTARWRRQDRAEARRRERPELIITAFRLRAPQQESSLQALISMRNAGPTLARGLVVGITSEGTRVAETSAARTLDVGEVVVAEVDLPPGLVQELRARQVRIEDACQCWVYYQDKFGDEHEFDDLLPPRERSYLLTSDSYEQRRDGPDGTEFIAYSKGDLVLLNDSEAERLLNLGAVRALAERGRSPHC